ncbi:MAG: hypothetical protein ACKOKG_10495 [Verrucomicrobiota bacterium]
MSKGSVSAPGSLDGVGIGNVGREGRIKRRIDLKMNRINRSPPETR